MSALNYFNQGSRAIILQDAATYDRCGTVTHLEVKGREIPECGAYLASTGSGDGAEVFAPSLGLAFQSIDELVAGGAAFFKRWGPSFVEELSCFGPPRFSCVVSGWSTVQRRVLDASFRLDPDTLSVEFAEDVEWSISPAWGGPVQDQIVRGIERFGPGFFDPKLHAVAMLELQRQWKTGETELIPNAHLVGGFVTLTTISEGGISTEVIHRWPEDAVGSPVRQRVAPPADAANVVPLASANRAERRRQAKVLGRAKA